MVKKIIQITQSIEIFLIFVTDFIGSWQKILSEIHLKSTLMCMLYAVYWIRALCNACKNGRTNGKEKEKERRRTSK